LYLAFGVGPAAKVIPVRLAFTLPAIVIWSTMAWFLAHRVARTAGLRVLRARHSYPCGGSVRRNNAGLYPGVGFCRTLGSVDVALALTVRERSRPRISGRRFMTAYTPKRSTRAVRPGWLWADAVWCLTW
jgi:hypothetical protein